MAFPIYQAQSLPKVRKLFCATRHFARFVSVHEPEEIVPGGRWQHDLILQVREVEHRLVRHVRPVQQVGTLLQGEIQGRNNP